MHLNGCPKHKPVPSTVSHTSSKAMMLSPQPKRSNVRNMDTKKFLQTDIKTYLEKDEHVTCISCQNCVKIKDKVLQFKYQRGI